MNLKRKIKLLFFTLAMTSASAVMAGNGVDLLYGIGGGVFFSQEKTNFVELDAAAVGEIFIGIEEDGFALEFGLANSLESGTAISSRDYSVSINYTTLAYRTIEKNNRYYKIKFGSMSADVDFTDNTATLATDGNVYGIAMGMRMAKHERMELEYMFYSSSDIDSTHIIVLRYIFGGTPSFSGFK